MEVREGDVEIPTGTGANGREGDKGTSMWEVEGEDNGGSKGRRDVWGRGGETKISEGVRDALREVKVLEGMYAARAAREEEDVGGGKGKRRAVKVKLMGCIGAAEKVG